MTHATHSNDGAQMSTWILVYLMQQPLHESVADIHCRLHSGFVNEAHLTYLCAGQES